MIKKTISKTNNDDHNDVVDCNDDDDVCWFDADDDGSVWIQMKFFIRYKCCFDVEFTEFLF